MKKHFNSRMIATTLAGAAVASVLALGVAQADQRQDAGGSQGAAMGQQSQRSGPYGQAPYGSGMGAHPSGGMAQQGKGSGDFNFGMSGRSQGQGYGRGQGHGPGYGGPGYGMQQHPGYGQMPQFDPDNLPEGMPEEMRERIMAQHAEHQERMVEMQGMHKEHQKAMEAGRKAYEEEMERYRKQRTEMKQDNR